MEVSEQTIIEYIVETLVLIVQNVAEDGRTIINGSIPELVRRGQFNDEYWI